MSKTTGYSEETIAAILIKKQKIIDAISEIDCGERAPMPIDLYDKVRLMTPERLESFLITVGKMIREEAVQIVREA